MTSSERAKHCPPSRYGPARGRRKLAAGALSLLLALAAAGAFPAVAAAQCAMCRSAFDSPEGRRMLRHYQAGIAFLLVVPFTTFATVAYFANKRRRELEDE